MKSFEDKKTFVYYSYCSDNNEELLCIHLGCKKDQPDIIESRSDQIFKLLEEKFEMFQMDMTERM